VRGASTPSVKPVKPASVVKSAASGKSEPGIALDDVEPVSLWKDRMTFTVRIIPGILERARWRNNLAWAWTDNFTIGLEYNPLAQDMHPTANWRLLDETATRPALMLGTSSDRIGTPHGTATYLTVAKSLKPQTGLPIAPYAGVSYSSYDDEFYFIGGASIQLSPKVNFMAMYDGVSTHGALSYTKGRHTFSLLAVDLEDEWHFGGGWSVRF
jgi:hypothetical protein